MFVFTSFFGDDSPATFVGADRITDFLSGTDRIDGVNTVPSGAATFQQVAATTAITTFAQALTAANVIFNDATSHVKIIAYTVGTDTVVFLDKDSDGFGSNADQAIILTGIVSLTSADFTLFGPTPV